MEIVDTSPRIEVTGPEYWRLLGYPPGRELSERAAELGQWAREWYAQNGRPWVYAREIAEVDVTSEAVRVGGAAFHSERLVRTFQEAEADGAVWAAVSAGPEAELEAQKLWSEEKPDEYFFLEMYASAVAESLIAALGARLCAWAEEQGTAVLPHYSPGYTGWDIAEQPRLLALAGGSLPGRLETLESGALRPKKSLIAIFGVTPNRRSLYRLTAGVPCANCSFHPCQYRRVPYGRSDYTVNEKALARWSSQRLRLERLENGGIQARFRYDGTTCSNMGRPLAFDYTVTLGPKSEGFPVREQQCAPAPGDTGYRAMCQYIALGDELLRTVAAEKPLLGKSISEIVGWRRPSSPAGCYCDAESRAHKWGLVFETIHYALRQRGDL